MDEQQIRADERARIALVFEEVAKETTDTAYAITLRELALVLRKDRDELINVGLTRLADEIIAEARTNQ